MNYSKEISHLLNNPIEILGARVGMCIEKEGDYDYADLRYKSEITERYCTVVTNVGEMAFRSQSFDTDYEQYDGETNSWEHDRNVKSTNLSIAGSSEKYSFKNSDAIFAERFHLSIQKAGSPRYFDNEYDLANYIELEASQDHSEMHRGKDPIMVSYSIPSHFLKYLAEQDKCNGTNYFSDINTDKLIEINKLIEASNNPKSFLEKLSSLPPAAQDWVIVNQKSEADLVKLIARENQSEIELSI